MRAEPICIEFDAQQLSVLGDQHPASVELISVATANGSRRWTAGPSTGLLEDREQLGVDMHRELARTNITMRKESCNVLSERRQAA